MKRGIGAVFAFAAAAVPPAALAHVEASGPSGAGEAWIAGPLLACAILYALGLGKLWSRAGVGRGVRRWRAACFGGGALVLLMDLYSPMHDLAQHWFSAHMGEHELLMAVAAPLFALSRPGGVMLWGLPIPIRGAAAALGQGGPVRAVWRRISRPGAASVIHGSAIWIWHVPALFDAALAHPGVHVLQHLGFLLSGLLFWAALLEDPLGERAGASVLWLFLTAMHTGALGALLLLARHLWYAPVPGPAESGALSALEDQQLAGLIMWIPAGCVYAVAALVLFGWWLRVRPDGRDALAPGP